MVNMVKRNPQMSENVNEVKETKEKKKIKIDVKNITILLIDFLAIILAYHVSLATIYKFDRMKETTYLLIATFVSIVIYVVTMWMLGAEYSYAFYLMGGLLQYFFTSGIRYVYRFFFLKRNKKSTER